MLEAEIKFKLNSLVGKIPLSFHDENYWEFCRKFYPEHLLHGGGLWQGSVLMLVSEEYFFFIKRSEDVPSYKGHLAFLGGHKRSEEIDPMMVCKREFLEETGLNPEALNFLGVLPPVFTTSNSLIIPYLATIEDFHQSVCNDIKSNGEWSVLLGIPFSILAEEKNWQYGLKLGKAKDEVILFCGIGTNQYKIFNSGHDPKSEIGPILLWGVTAKIVWNLMRCYFS